MKTIYIVCILLLCNTTVLAIEKSESTPRKTLPAKSLHPATRIEYQWAREELSQKRDAILRQLHNQEINPKQARALLYKERKKIVDSSRRRVSGVLLKRKIEEKLAPKLINILLLSPEKQIQIFTRINQKLDIKISQSNKPDKKTLIFRIIKEILSEKISILEK